MDLVISSGASRLVRCGVQRYYLKEFMNAIEIVSFDCALLGGTGRLNRLKLSR